MEKRWVIFFVLSGAVLALNIVAMRWMAPPQQRAARPAARQKADQDAAGKKAAGKDAAAKDADGRDAAGRDAADQQAAGNANADGGEAEPRAERQPRAVAGPAAKQPRQWAALGSADPNSPYRMLVIFTNRGGAVERIELSTDRYTDLDDTSGYLGYLAGIDAGGGRGVRVRVVGAGTPAAKAGLKAGDVIVGINGRKVSSPSALEARLSQSRPGNSLTLTIDRGGKPRKLVAVLARQPMKVIDPEAADQLSFLTTLEEIDGVSIAKGQRELPDVRMRTGNWKLLPPNPGRPDEVAFEWLLAEQGLKITKTYRLARIQQEQHGNINAPGYHLDLSLKVANVGQRDRTVAYRLDGPTGLPTQGWWYAYSSKISPYWWDSPGMRDFVIATRDNNSFQYAMVSASKIAEDEGPVPWSDVPLIYIGVDAQYFSVVIIPQTKNPGDLQVSKAMPIRAGPVPKDSNKTKLINVSTRIISQRRKLEPDDSLEHTYRVFAGPKRPALLAQYAQPFGLNDMVYYGWFGWVSRPMLWLLHRFHDLVGSYGLAIIMLTVLVRSCMFPLSRKQALGAQKMQELQPEMKRLAEKYKGNVEQRTKAQQELFRKHNYNPLAGCLPALVQLPIFLGLYRSLAVDIELYQAPLISEAIRWCSNLGAPDMLWYWEPYLPGFLAGPTGWLGPYLNVLPLVTIALFIWQQKMFMPPPTDEQAAMQQRVMRYMMIFIGVLFYKVASGLCIYFIASSLWGIAERKLLPKAAAAGQTPGTEPIAAPPRSQPGPRTNGAAGSKKKKQKGRR